MPPEAEKSKPKYKCRGPRVLNEDGTPGLERVGCGHDFTSLVEECPADGKVYEIECPKCGNVETMERIPFPLSNENVTGRTPGAPPKV